MFKIIKEFNEFQNKNKVKLAAEFIKDFIKGTEWENKIYIAGGYVRDELMGIEPHDIDLLVNTNNGGILFAEWITKKLGIYREESNPITYPRFGTAMFTLRKMNYEGEDISDVEIECVMPRKETYEEGNRKPDVSSGDLGDDVHRRDFTVNSLLKNLSTDEVVDLTGMGKDDIKKGVVRTPLEPDVIFSEDPLRMLRSIRFSVKYNWKLPIFMIKSIKKNAKKISYISFERINDELSKMLLTDNPDKAIRLIQFTGLSKYIFPELDKLINLPQNKYHDSDAMTHTLKVLKNTPPDIITRLAALFHDIGKYKTISNDDGEVHFYGHEEMSGYIAADILRRLKYPKTVIRDVVDLIVNHMRTKESGNEGNMSKRSLRKLKLEMGNNLEKLLDLIHADNISHAKQYCMPDQVENIRKKLKDLDISDNVITGKLPLDGDDIMRILNINKGPMVGKMLDKLKDIYLDNPKITKEEAEKIIKNEYDKSF